MTSEYANQKVYTNKKPLSGGADQSRKTLFLGIGELAPTSKIENLALSGIFLFYHFCTHKSTACHRMVYFYKSSFGIEGN